MKNHIINRFLSLNEIKNFISAFSNDKLHDKITYCSPFAGSSRVLFLTQLVNLQNKILLLLPDVQSVNETKIELEILGIASKSIAFENLNPDSLQEKLTQIDRLDQFIILSTYDLLSVKLPSKIDIKKHTTIVETGSELPYDEIIEYLNELNYQQEKHVEIPGDYAVRGSIIDFWSYSEKQPARLEFDGDFLESIRYFDSESQRSSGRVDFVTLAPQLDFSTSNSSTIFDYLNSPLIICSKSELEHFINPKQQESEMHLIDIDDELRDELFDSDGTQIVEKENIVENKFIYESLVKLLNADAYWLIEEEIKESPHRFELHLFESPKINSNFKLLFDTLSRYAAKSFDIFITTENELQSKRLFELLSDYNEELKNLLESGKVKISVLPIKEGFISRQEKLLVLSDYQIFNKPYRTKSSLSKKYKKSRAKDFASIKKGDFVVHETYGIGQYAGLETIKIGMTEQESIKILYAEGGVVYVNLNYLSLVKKFSSKDNAHPKLSVLGSGEWKKTKKKVKSKIKEAARELITLYAKRKSVKGISYSADSLWQKELEASFFYEDTPDQTRVTEEVKTDMESESPMDRLVCGDVGFGKTEIAVRAAFKAVNDGKQVGLLVPTTILAEQHFNTFKDRLSQFPVNVKALSRFSTKSEQKKIVDNLSEGQVDIVIGTHRLLSNDIKFKDLGLLIIDEEHRFGVMAKEKLRRFRVNVDTLTLTATPIPRTLNLSLLGARDLSIIATPPPNRQPIHTKVETFDILKIRGWILDEVKRAGQVYFVHDRVQSIDKLAAYLQKHIPGVKIAVAHGQMKPAQLEKVIYEFLNKRHDMLLSTKIIESGLDIPNVNTIIVNRADRFGLAELHQLRGRVGRSNRQAFAYFIVPSLSTITKKAIKRLQAIEEYTELGEGFNLSMRDLEIRGAGNLLGTEQHGAIDSVGFDLYVKLLDEAVEELKKDEFSEVFKDLPEHIDRTEPAIDAYFELGIPNEFMPEQSDRLSYYTALFSVANINEIEEIREEMIDRFGKLPEIIERLILSAKLRFYASFAMFERIIIQEKKVSLVFPKSEKEEFYKNKFTNILQWVVDNYSKEISFKQGKDSMKLELIKTFDSVEEIMNYLIEFCKEVKKKISNPS